MRRPLVDTCRCLVRTCGFALATLSAIVAAAQSSTEKSIPAIARETNPSVVRIIVRDQSGAEMGSGSGFVVSNDGKIVTNYHVVHVLGTTQAEVRFTDGASYLAQGVVATDPDKDLALLKLQAAGKEFHPLVLGDSEKVQTGERVVAIGSPLAGFSPVNTEATVSDGIVSGVRDWTDHRMKVFQITAPISPGSSGGPLMNSNGEVIGVTFAQLVGGQNLNFAIPIAYVQPLFVDGPTKSFAEINKSSPVDHATSDVAPTGSYTGVWQSSEFSVSGAASMTIRIADKEATAEIFLTGGEVRSASLSGSAHKTGENIWTVELSSQRPRLSVRGIFRGNTFVGDYTYSRFPMRDRGQWVLKKE